MQYSFLLYGALLVPKSFRPNSCAINLWARVRFAIEDAHGVIAQPREGRSAPLPGIRNGVSQNDYWLAAPQIDQVLTIIG